MDAALDKALSFAIGLVVLNVAGKDGEVLFQHAIEDCLAGVNRLVYSSAAVATSNRSKSRCPVLGEQNRSLIRRNDLEHSIEDFFLHGLQAAN